MSLTTPDKIRNLQRKLYCKAKAESAMPREQVMCTAVSCGSAAGGVGLAGASLKYVWSLISGARRFCSKSQAASCYVARLESAIHGALLVADRRRSECSGDYSQVLPHCCAFGPVLVRCAFLRQAIGIDARGSVPYFLSRNLGPWEF